MSGNRVLVQTSTEYEFTQGGDARDAFEGRVKRLREAKLDPMVDREKMIVAWRERGEVPNRISETVTLQYFDATEPTS